MKISIQYLAGYFDADGYFCASKDGSGYKFYAGLSSTDRNIVDEFSNRFGGGVLTRYTEMSKLNKRGAAVAQSYPLGSFEG